MRLTDDEVYELLAEVKLTPTGYNMASDWLEMHDALLEARAELERMRAYLDTIPEGPVSGEVIDAICSLAHGRQDHPLVLAALKPAPAMREKLPNETQDVGHANKEPEPVWHERFGWGGPPDVPK